MSNPVDHTGGPRPRPLSPTPVAAGARVDETELRVMLVSGAAIAVAVVGLVVTLLVGSSTGDAAGTAQSDTTTSESAAPAPAAVPAQATPVQRQNLADLTPVDTTAYTGTISVNGRSYQNAIYQQFNGCNTTVSHTYNLNGEWSRFSSAVGIAEGANTGSVLRFEVVADDESIYSSGDVPVGESPQVDVSVADVQALTISFTFVEGNMESCGQVGNGVWGDAALTE